MKQQQQQQQQISKNTTEFIWYCCSQLGMEPAVKGGLHTEGDSVGGNSLFVGEQLTLEDSFWVRGGGSCPPLSALGPRLTWTWAGPLCAATVSVSSCVHQPCCVRRTPSAVRSIPADSNNLPTSSSA